MDRDPKFIVGGILGRIGSSRSNLNSVLSIDRQTNGTVKLDTRAVSKTLY